MKSKTEIFKIVEQFVKEIGVHTILILDPEGTQRAENLKKKASDIGCSFNYLEHTTHLANLTELYIRLIKESARKGMKDSDSPLRFWDYCAESRALVNNLTAKNLFQLNGSNTNFKITGDEGNISNLYQFKCFDWCYFQDSSLFPHQQD